MNQTTQRLLMGAAGASSGPSIGTQWGAIRLRENMNGAAYSPTLGRFVIVGNAGYIMTSTDSISWIGVRSGTSTFNAVCWGNGMFVAVGVGGTVSTSTDGLNWTVRTTPVSSSLSGVACLGSVFVAVMNSQTVIRSTDGVNWTLYYGLNNNIDFTPSDITASDTKFVACSSSSIFESTDGINWVFSGNGLSYGRSSQIETWSVAYSPELSLFLATGANDNIRTSPDGLIWTRRNPGTTSVSFNSAVWAGDKFVIVGGTANIRTSPDGIDWTFRSNGGGTASTLNYVTWSGSLLVAVGVSGSIRTSPDGITWTLRTSGTTENLSCVTWAGAQFVALSYSGRVLTSPDGITWTNRGVPTGASGGFSDIAWSGSIMVATTSGVATSVYTSVDGITWNQQSISNTGLLNRVRWTGTHFVAVGASGRIAVSSDGISWANVSSGTTVGEFTAIGFGAGRAITIGQGGVARTATDVTAAWSFVNDGFENTYLSITWTGTQLVVSGNGGIVMTSPDGSAWTYRNTGVTSNWQAVGSSGSTIVVGALSGVNRYSTDGGLTWAAGSTTISHINAVASNGSAFVISGQNAYVATSPTGATWTIRNTGTFSAGQKMAYNGSLFVYFTNQGLIYTSPNGLSWTQRVSSTTSPISDAVWLIDRFFAGVGSSLITSTNGTAWQFTTIPGIFNIYGIARNSSVCVLVGGNGIVKYSSDLSTWTSSTTGGTEEMRSVVWSQELGLFAAVGTLTNVFTSPDGITWTNRGMPASATGTTFNRIIWSGSLFVAVGTNGSIITSPDGVTWTARTSGVSNALFDVGYFGGVFLAIGSTGTMRRSTDGVTWSAVSTGSAQSLSGIAGNADKILVVGAVESVLSSPPSATIII